MTGSGKAFVGSCLTDFMITIYDLKELLRSAQKMFASLKGTGWFGIARPRQQLLKARDLTWHLTWHFIVRTAHRLRNESGEPSVKLLQRPRKRADAGAKEGKKRGS
jgi:hypothetical protein